MKTGIIITVSVVTGLLVLFLILKLIYSFIRNRLGQYVTDRFDEKKILGVTTRANFFGINSKGGGQIRGNGALVLTRKDLYFIRAIPQKEYQIPIRSISSVSMPRLFNGKSAVAPLLCLNYDTESGKDSIAWAVADAEKWKDAIEKLIS